ncbi:odorant receptor 13a-like isoform X3 [Temnothorax longispinosus]|uniref:odorant receptor 13a-like isoform X3 n=1 Tax=Temnothorax longispinosus TaxID=300112 RepID=UPI003A99B4CF
MITSAVSPTLIIGLRFFGLWPGVSYSVIYWLSFMSSILIIQYFQYLYIFNHLKVSELSNLVDCLIVNLYYSLTFLKLVILWIHRRVFHTILAHIENDWRECISVDQHLHIMTIKANISHTFSNGLLSFNVITGIFYFLGDYVHHVSGQVDIICEEFRNISRTALQYGSSLFSFGILVERHNRILSLSENIEKLFSFVALMQVVWSTLVICGLGFIIVISIHNETGVFALVKTMFGYFAIIMEVFFICFAGEYLGFKGNLIARATYETPWYNMPSNQSKIIIFILLRSQKRLAITAGKMMDMSFETFTSIMKASVSFISVLNAMY